MTMTNSYAIEGAQIFTGEEFLDGYAVIVANDRISQVLPAEELTDAVQRHRVEGLLVPGFIDIQVNGGGGVMFNDDPSSGILKTIAEAHRQFGTTRLFPTLITCEPEKMRQASAAVVDARRAGAESILGIHFEGPYLNVARHGAHDPALITPPSATDIDFLKNTGVSKVIVTLAPEAVPIGTIQSLTDAGILVCAGHSNASYEEIQQARLEGLRGYTHLFNAMSPLLSREPGVVGAALDDTNSWCSIIVDGYHAHPASLRIAIQAKANGKTLLVTDAMGTVGSDKKYFHLYDEVIHSHEGRCVNSEGRLAGSDLDMASAVRNTVNLLNLPLAESLRMASLYPAQFLAMDTQFGRISKGYIADLALLDSALQVTDTWVAGVR